MTFIRHRSLALCEPTRSLARAEQVVAEDYSATAAFSGFQVVLNRYPQEFHKGKISTSPFFVFSDKTQSFGAQLALVAAKSCLINAGGGFSQTIELSEAIAAEIFRAASVAPSVFNAFRDHLNIELKGACHEIEGHLERCSRTVPDGSGKRVVAGNGVALWHASEAASKEDKSHQFLNVSEGIREEARAAQLLRSIVFEAVKKPLVNLVSEQGLKLADYRFSEPWIGFDIKTQTYVDMFEANLVDDFEILTEALWYAAETASIMFSGAFISLSTKENAVPGMEFLKLFAVHDKAGNLIMDNLLAARDLPSLLQHVGLIEFILTDEELKSAPLETRLEALDRYVALKRPSEPISALLRKFVPELFEAKVQNDEPAKSLALSVPRRAPERWPSDPSKRTENPAEFATRVYRKWMDAGVLSRPDLKRLDPLLFASLDNWLKNNRRKPNPEPLPEGFNLLTLEQVNDAWIDRVQAGVSPLPKDPEELSRFALALRYRVEHGNPRK